MTFWKRAEREEMRRIEAERAAKEAAEQKAKREAHLDKMLALEELGVNVWMGDGEYFVGALHALLMRVKALEAKDG